MTAAEIISELQAARPAASPQLRAHIERVASSTPPARPSLAARFGLDRRRTLLVALPAAGLLAVASAGVVGVVGSGSPAAPSSVEAARDVAQPTEKLGASEADALAGGSAGVVTAPSYDQALAQTPGPAAGRAQRVTATLTVQVADTDALSEATQEALRTTRALGGFVVTVSYATAQDGSAQLTLRVPTNRVQEAITRLSSLGTIVAQQVQIQDLQEAIDALDRRVANLQERIARLTAQIDDPATDATTRATLVARRSAARAELAAARRDRAGNTAEARLATIQLALTTDPEASAVPPAPGRFDRALDRAVEILALEATVLLFALVLVGPFLAVALLVWWARRLAARRADDRLLRTAGP